MKLKALLKNILLLLLLMTGTTVSAQIPPLDTSIVIQTPNLQQEQFYDTLENRANRRKLTGWLYDAIITPPRPYVDKKALALDYFKNYEGKIIAEIKINALDVFGPTCTDTTKKADHWAERAANKIHTKSNLKTIRKLLLFKIGDRLNPELMYENERIIRDLSYIKDVRIYLEQDPIYPGLVNVLVLTKDRFSFGVSGGVNGTRSGDIEIYNRNIFGVGHEVSVKFVGHVEKEPYLGVETFYTIKNIAGRFLDIRLGYLNTYRREGFAIDFNKPFLTQNIKWGYGGYSARMFRTDRITNNDPVKVDDPMDLSANYIWGGRSFNISPRHENATELVVSTGINNWNFFERPAVAPENSHFFSNHTLYMMGLTISQRRYIQDQLIYSYGITEDIPEGFKNELIYGYDANEFGDRHYLHFFTSNGNLLLSRNGYLFTTAGVGGYLKEGHFEEGMIYGDVNFISKLHTAGRKRVRTFVDLNYTLGIRRFDIENLSLEVNDHIRGFDSDIAVGKQRLNLKLEHVVFLPRQFYKFNIALFGFADVGAIGSNSELIFKQDYYTGLGLGIRLHNENLVFETFRLRLAFYPFHPDDESFIGFALDEQSKQRFISFEPTGPEPVRFE
ncbi:BamA/TamA family outer membrane protein [Draconibacterium halophilum]|uniref:Bacterial surface antigen (D15) domain-containing protein n=1 Tax=Draconibacterium halophilum TaxID=2706887 RepID=A0A6C0RG89_9BACT|nr:hypothetical protein [Draconibacterium halophilum]QIA08685.1 hypothetical protein G0Q07_13575 [Draconibacterium halophilum]